MVSNEINPGGVNGTGKGVVDTNCKDFQGLRAAIKEHVKRQTPLEKRQYKLMALKFQEEIQNT